MISSAPPSWQIPEVAGSDPCRASLAMRYVCNNLNGTVPIRPRVAFVLAIAERVMPALTDNPEAFGAVQRALADGWRWEQGEDILAKQLYEDDEGDLALQGSLVRDGEASAAVQTATSAFYYTLWHAFYQDLSRGLVREGDVPLMTEVTEDVLAEVCDFATRTSLCDGHWITAIANRLSTDFHTDNPEELGPIVYHNYFIK
jgi:hypothetical protein